MNFTSDLQRLLKAALRSFNFRCIVCNLTEPGRVHLVLQYTGHIEAPESPAGRKPMEKALSP